MLQRFQPEVVIQVQDPRLKPPPCNARTVLVQVQDFLAVAVVVVVVAKSSDSYHTRTQAACM